MLNGKVGNDVFGSIIKQLVGDQRAKSFKTVEGQSTSIQYCSGFTRGIDRIFLHHPGTNDTFGAEDIDYDAAAECKLFHFGYPPLMKRMYADNGRELVEMFKSVKSLGVTTSLDMSLPDRIRNPAGQLGRKCSQMSCLMWIFFCRASKKLHLCWIRIFSPPANPRPPVSDPVHKYQTAD